MGQVVTLSTLLSQAKENLNPTLVKVVFFFSKSRIDWIGNHKFDLIVMPRSKTSFILTIASFTFCYIIKNPFQYIFKCTFYNTIVMELQLIKLWVCLSYMQMQTFFLNTHVYRLKLYKSFINITFFNVYYHLSLFIYTFVDIYIHIY